ncbi:MAG: MotA/TolQ/ExbB proton channel family protein [Candidatus Omnitrophica bacterium]|nr:MotA/TolQ/ExbB proton channel family protein [Candidatus Omnitrophota bacterium]
MYPTAWQLISQASLIVKLILVILAALSVVSWGLILYKSSLLRAASRESAAWLKLFDQQGDLDAVAELAPSFPISPMARVLLAAYPARQVSAAAFERAVAKAVAAELERLQSSLTFLATTGSAAPFIGLLGTVWGIMDAFRGIGAAGSASLAVVSPAIAEALITTAAGLLAAIPAVMAYNTFLSWNRRLARQVDAFAQDFQARVNEANADQLTALPRV